MKLYAPGLIILLTSCIISAQPLSADGSCVSGQAVKSMLRTVAESQIKPLADGDYNDAVSMAALRKLKQPEGISWSYPWGITLAGMLQASETLSDSRFGDFAIKHNEICTRNYAWLKLMEAKFQETEEWQSFISSRRSTRVWRLMRLGNLDNCGTMGAAYLECAKRKNTKLSQEESQIINTIADWVINKLPRLEDGTFWRPNETDVAQKWPLGTIWADDLYMACSFLVRYSQHTGDLRHLNDAISQIINMASLLQSEDGLWYHGYSVKKCQASPIKWARANGWAMMATVDVLTVVPEAHPKREVLLQILRKQIARLIAVQSPTGGWRQILDQEDAWDETSSTAIFIFSIARAVNQKWISATYLLHALKAFEFLQKQIDENGIIHGTCQGTALSLTAEYYLNRTRPKGDYHGAGLVLLAGLELLKTAKQCLYNQ